MFLQPTELLSRVSVPAGARVGDFGAGSGHYALGVIERLGPETTIYAFDAFMPILAKLEREAKKRGGRLYGIVADLNRHIPVRNNLLQFAILSNILNALDSRECFLVELARVMAPGARALVVDWISSFRDMGPTAGRVITPAEAVRLIRGAGFSAGEMLPAGSHHYAFVATRI